MFLGPQDPTTATKWKNVFALQVEGTKDGDKGSRLPAVWIRPGLGDGIVMLQIGYCIGDNWNSAVNPTFNFNNDYGFWNRLKISQTGGTFDIEINSLHHYVFSTSNPNPQTWTNVKVVTGNTYGNVNFVPAVGKYRNFVIKNLEAAENNVLCPEWSFSIDFYLDDQPVTAQPIGDIERAVPPVGIADKTDMVPFVNFSGSYRVPSIYVANHDAANAVLYFNYLQMTRKGLPSAENAKFVQGG